MPAGRTLFLLLFAANAAPPFARYLGGGGTDDCDGIAVDRAGDIYLACHSDSPDFPGLAARPQPASPDAMDGVVVKLNGRTGKIVWATRLGGSKWDAAGELVLAPDGSIYVLGTTRSADFPTTADAVQRRFGGPDRDVFLARLDHNGKVVYATLLGGSKNDEASALALGPDGAIYIGGVTFAPDFPGARRGELGPRGAQDAFLARLRPGDPKSLETTILGGGSVDRITSIALDRSGNVFAAGYTSSPDFPVKNPLQPTLKGEIDAFLAKFRAVDLALTFSTYLGGSKPDGAYALALDASGNPILSGVTASDDFPSTAASFQPHRRGPVDAFVTKVDRDGARIIWSTYFGGSKANSDQFEAGGMSVDAAGRIWLAGMTSSTDLPVRTPAQRSFAGGDFDGFVAAFSADGARLCYATYAGGSRHDILEGIAIGLDAVYASGLTSSLDLAASGSYAGGPYDAFLVTVLQPSISSCR